MPILKFDPAGRAVLTTRLSRRLAEGLLILSLPISLLFLVLFRPAPAFYALQVVPIALVALRFKFGGGILAALAALAGLALLVGLDSDPVRRAITLRELWPILVPYLSVGPVVGWLATREKKHARRLRAVARNLRVVAEIAQATTSSLDLEETLNTVIYETQKLLPYRRAAIVLRTGSKLRVAADSSDDGELSRSTIPFEASATQAAIRKNRPWVGGPEQISAFEDARLIGAGGRYCLVVPLGNAQKGVGALILVIDARDDLDDTALTRLAYVANHLTIAIEHARLFAAEQQHAHQLAAVGAASREIAAVLDLQRTLNLVMAKAAATLPLDAGAIFQFSSEHHAYHVAVSHNLSQKHVEKITFAFEDGVPGWVVQNRASLIIPEARMDPRVHPFIVEEGVCSVLAVPLIARERVVGVLNLYRKSASPPFSAQALQLAELFAAQAAYAIENARLVDELRKAAAELEERVNQRTRQLKETQAQVIRTEKLAVVGRLATSVAHEVNNPLQAITLQLQLMTEEPAAEPLLPRLRVVQDEVGRINGIVRRLLDFQRPQAGVKGLFDLSRLLSDVLDLAGKQLQQAGILVKLNVTPNLPMVDGSGDQLKQVFLNLILNAVEAMPSGGTLEIDLQCVENVIRILFLDTGPGMPPEVLKRLFEPFFSTKPDGTGLGLAISHEIITQHDGQLAAASRPGGGSRFELLLPAAARPAR